MAYSRPMMGIPDDFTAFWAATIAPNSFTRVTVPEGVVCSLTNGTVAVAQGKAITEGRVTIFVSVEGADEVALFPFRVGQFESATTDMMFGPGTVISLRSEGADAHVNVSGYLLGGFSVKVEPEA